MFDKGRGVLVKLLYLLMLIFVYFNVLIKLNFKIIFVVKI